MRILVAGGTGVLGRLVVPALVKQGHTVAATTRSQAKAGMVSDMGADPIIVDAFDAAAWQAETQAFKPDIVIHLLTDLSDADMVANSKVRVEGTKNLVESANKVGARVIAESISWVNEPSMDVADESTPLEDMASEPRRTTIDGVKALEDVVLAADGVVLRCAQLYGNGTWFSKGEKMAEAALASELPATNEVVAFVSVDDAARAFVDALEWPSGVVIIADDESAPGTQWVPVFAKAIGAPVPKVEQGKSIGRPVSNKKARSLGWVPSQNWREGLTAL